MLDVQFIMMCSKDSACAKLQKKIAAEFDEAGTLDDNLYGDHYGIVRGISKRAAGTKARKFINENMSSVLQIYLQALASDKKNRKSRSR